MDRETATLALVAVTLFALSAALSPLLPSGGERFSELGVLGQGNKIGGYPTNVSVGEPFHLFLYVGNHEGRVSYYQVLAKAGNKNTTISNSSSAKAPIILTRSLFLDDNGTSTFPVTISMPVGGADQRLIFELWSFNVTSSQFSYTGLWDQLWLNVTGR